MANLLSTQSNIRNRLPLELRRKIYSNYCTAFNGIKQEPIYTKHFIHRYYSPYDEFTPSKKQNLIKYLTNKTNDINDDNSWKDREHKQNTFMKLFISLVKKRNNDNTPFNYSNNEELIKIFNKEYFNYINSQTAIYDDKGYLNKYRQLAKLDILRAIRSGLRNKQPGIKDTIKKSEIGLYNYLTQEIKQIKEELKGILDSESKNALEKIEKSQNYSDKELNKYKKNAIERERKIEMDLIKKIQEMLNSNQDFDKVLISNIITDSYTYKFDKTTVQKVGNENEKIITKLLNQLIDESFDSLDTNINMTNGLAKAIHKGDEVKTIRKPIGSVYYNLNDKEHKTYTIKTDISFAFNEKILDVLEIKDEELRKDFKNKELITNISVKNYFLENNKHISAQSNKNFITFLNQMSHNTDKSKNILDGLTDLKMAEIGYYLSNDMIRAESKYNFFLHFKELCEKWGTQTTFALNKIDDEVDFLLINQRIIPSYYLQKLYEEEEKNNNSIYRVSIKEMNVQPTADYLNSNGLSNIAEPEKGKFRYYSNNYLSLGERYGKNIQEKIYIHTYIDNKYIQNILNKINNLGGK